MPNELQLQDVIGQPVSSVCFVQDYVELSFDGPILRCLVGPTLKGNKLDMTFPENGSRDAICSLIGQVVQRLTLDDGVKLEVEFSSGLILTVPLDPKSRNGPESMHFVPRIGGPIQVW